MEARVAKLEAAVEHIQADVAEIKGVLARLAPVIDRMDGFLQAVLPTLATKEDVANLRTEMKGEIVALRSETKADFNSLRTEIEKRPTRRQSVLDIVMIVGAIGAILTIGSRFAH